VPANKLGRPQGRPYGGCAFVDIVGARLAQGSISRPEIDFVDHGTQLLLRGGLIEKEFGEFTSIDVT